MNTRNAIALTLATPALGLTLALGLELSPAVHAHHDDTISAQEGIWPCTTDAYARELGDDDCDGIIREDESGWDCQIMGNGICGPDAVIDAAAFDRGAYVGGFN